MRKSVEVRARDGWKWLKSYNEAFALMGYPNLKKAVAIMTKNHTGTKRSYQNFNEKYGLELREQSVPLKYSECGARAMDDEKPYLTSNTKYVVWTHKD